MMLEPTANVSGTVMEYVYCIIIVFKNNWFGHYTRYLKMLFQLGSAAHRNYG